jgi:hypothetical protein
VRGRRRRGDPRSEHDGRDQGMIHEGLRRDASIEAGAASSPVRDGRVDQPARLGPKTPTACNSHHPVGPWENPSSVTAFTFRKQSGPEPLGRR